MSRESRGAQGAAQGKPAANEQSDGPAPIPPRRSRSAKGQLLSVTEAPLAERNRRLKPWWCCCEILQVQNEEPLLPS